MSYNFKRALGISFLMYIATFVVALVCGLVSGQDMSSMAVIPDYYWYVGMVGVIILMVLFSFWYFKTTTVMASAKAGLLFSLTTVVLSIILDIILFSLGNASGAEVDIWMYYGDFRFWIIVILILLTGTLVGHKKSVPTI